MANERKELKDYKPGDRIKIHYAHKLRNGTVIANDPEHAVDGILLIRFWFIIFRYEMQFSYCDEELNFHDK